VAAPFDHPEAARWVLREASSQSKYCEARYDRDGSRWEPRLSPLTFAARPGALPIGPGDVLLVTGGGKGIGAECALALARKTGAQLALLGRSAPSTDAELAANLERFAAAGIRCRYRAADVTSASAIRGAIAEVERDLGKITAFLHAAGANTPQLISSLDEAAFHRTFAPKLQGARNVLATIEPGQLRAFITFGSIIGRAGLAGEADYALANEWLTSLTEEFAAANPRCKCVAAEWSVWSGIGMGARLGRIESLRQQGITPISPERGVEILEQLLSHPLPKTAVVVTGRYGELPTLTMAETDLPLLRFLEHPKLAYPGVELIADSTLSTETDPYIDEHVYHGERLFPAVMGLEAMAQAAMALFGSAEPPGFENVKLTRPVVVPRGGKATIRVAALARGDGEVEVVLRCEETAFQTDHFRATCRFPVGVDRLLKSEPGSKIKAPMSESARVPLDVERDLYDDLLFHTGRFRRVKNYRLLRARECLAQIEPDIKTAWFGPYLPQDRVLGDTGVRDAAIHAIQACIPHAQLLPAGVERIVIGKLPCLAERFHGTDRAPELFLHARERRRDGDTFYYDVELLGEDGSSLERWENLCLKKVGDLNRKTPWPISLLGPYIERRLEELIPGSRVAVIVGQGISSDEAMRSACASETMTSLSIHRRSDGKPEIFGDSAEAVSASHSGDLTMAVAGPGPLGCDLEPVSARGQETWQTLLGSARFRLAGLIAQEAAEDLDAAATRVWTALECLKKAGYPAETPLVLGSVHKDSWILLKSGPVTAATYTTRVQDLPERLVLGVLASQSC
jgi:enediyne polyketide synthase